MAHNGMFEVRVTGGQKVVSSTLIIPTIFLYLSHHSPLDDAFFVSRYIPFNPRVVQREIPPKILRRETFSAPFGRRRTHSPPEILRLRKGSPSRFFELRRKVRADSPTATICLRNSAYMIFRNLGTARLGFTSKAENAPRCFLGITCVLRVAHHYLECCFPKPISPPKVPKNEQPHLRSPAKNGEWHFSAFMLGKTRKKQNREIFLRSFLA